MPHLTLEYSANILEKDSLLQLFTQCHAILVERLPTSLSNCKSRALQSEVYCIGDGQSQHAFIHLAVKILAGRSDEIIGKVGERLLQLLMTHFSKSMEQFQLQFSVEISELGKHYFKVL